MKLTIIVTASLFALVVICLIAARIIRKKMRVWLFCSTYGGTVFETAIYSAIDPQIRRNPDTGLYSRRSLSAFGACNEFLLKDGAIEAMLGHPMKPDDPPVSVPCGRLLGMYVLAPINEQTR